MTKRRVAKGRRVLSQTDELEAWDTYFSHGHDWFSTATELLGINPFAEEYRFRSQGEKDALLAKAGREAWQRLGALFLSTWKPDERHAKPWALAKFGEPRQGDKNVRVEN